MPRMPLHGVHNLCFLWPEEELVCSDCAFLSLPDIWNVTGQKIKVLLTRPSVCMIPNREGGDLDVITQTSGLNERWHHITQLFLTCCQTIPNQLASRKTAACFALLRGKVYEAMENLEPNEG